MDKDYLNEFEEHQANRISRKSLLPVWIKIFAWIFLITGLVVPIAVFAGLNGWFFNTALYGFATNEPFSRTGILVISLFALKAIVSIGLLLRKDWAIKTAIADGIIGILLCMLIMILYIINKNDFTFRIELAALVPYLSKMLKIEKPWRDAV